MASTFSKPTTDQQGPTPLLPYQLKIKFDPYNHDQVQNLMSRLHKDFGRDSTRWCWISLAQQRDDHNVYRVELHFRDSADAVLVGLKYLGENKT